MGDEARSGRGRRGAGAAGSGRRLAMRACRRAAGSRGAPDGRGRGYIGVWGRCGGLSCVGWGGMGWGSAVVMLDGRFDAFLFSRPESPLDIDESHLMFLFLYIVLALLRLLSCHIPTGDKAQCDDHRMQPSVLSYGNNGECVFSRGNSTLTKCTIYNLRRIAP